jgi:uncharacterized membrane protein (UPF0182 family)
MLIHRSVRERLATLAPYIGWDPDAYMVITAEGRLVWIVDGYTTSEAHPYAREISTGTRQSYNYIRNSVKATIDAYDGDTKIYIFDDQDPLILAYHKLFPGLMVPASEWPADLRSHTHALGGFVLVRRPRSIAPITMRDPESFYNQRGTCGISRRQYGAGRKAGAGDPQLSGGGRYRARLIRSFLLTIPFTPHNKQNLIGPDGPRAATDRIWARSFSLQLPSRRSFPDLCRSRRDEPGSGYFEGPVSLEPAGLAGATRPGRWCFPSTNTFLFVSPIYIQAAQAKMPQLEKIVLAAGSRLVYADTYQKALADLRPCSVECRDRRRPPFRTAAPARAAGQDRGSAKFEGISIAIAAWRLKGSGRRRGRNLRRSKRCERPVDDHDAASLLRKILVFQTCHGFPAAPVTAGYSAEPRPNGRGWKTCHVGQAFGLRGDFIPAARCLGRRLEKPPQAGGLPH